MSSVEVRHFRRSDREQLTALVNAHVQAVVPGVSVSVNTVMSQLERDPSEFIVDPWVTDRVTLVAEQRRRVVAAAHLLRYGGGGEVGECYRDAGEINWLLHWPRASYWPDSDEAADRLGGACLAQLRRWDASRWLADGALPAPGIYGVPEQWPHVRALYQRIGFAQQGRTEVVLLALVDQLPRPAEPPLPGMEVRRTVGVNGTRLSACLGEEVLGYIEVEANLADGGRLGSSAAGRTSATCTWPSGTAAAGWRPGWSARRATGCDWRGSSGCSTTPPPTSTTAWRCWGASASASSPARPAAGFTRGRELDARPAGRWLEELLRR
jgi:hypothetical protein